MRRVWHALGISNHMHQFTQSFPVPDYRSDGRGNNNSYLLCDLPDSHHTPAPLEMSPGMTERLSSSLLWSKSVSILHNSPLSAISSRSFPPKLWDMAPLSHIPAASVPSDRGSVLKQRVLEASRIQGTQKSAFQALGEPSPCSDHNAYHFWEF